MAHARLTRVVFFMFVIALAPRVGEGQIAAVVGARGEGIPIRCEAVHQGGGYYVPVQVTSILPGVLPGGGTISPAFAPQLGGMTVVRSTSDSTPVDTQARNVEAALNALHSYLSRSEYDSAWREYLRSDMLRRELARRRRADPWVLGTILQRYAEAGDDGERPRFVAVRRALCDLHEVLPPPAIEDLSKVALAERDIFIPLGEADLIETRQTLDSAMDRLVSRFRRAGPEIEPWKAHLQWETLQEELARKKSDKDDADKDEDASEDGPDLRKLDQVYAEFASGEPGLELPCFRDVRLALRAYLTTARAIDTADVKEQYQELMAALPERLEAYQADPNAPDAATLVGVIEWLEQAGQGRRLAAGIRYHYRRSNVLIDVSSELVGAVMRQPIQETRPVRDHILGTDIHGWARVTGDTNAVLVPSATNARIDMLILGTIRSNTIGYNGPARIHATGTTRMTARKSILIDSERIWSLPTIANAQTSSTINDIQADRFPRLVRRVATKRAATQRGATNAIAADHAEAQFMRDTDRRVEPMIAQANRDFRAARQPLKQRRLYPARLDFSTTSRTFCVRALQAEPNHLAAPDAPPSRVGRVDLCARVHESAVNNTLSTVLGGRIIREEHLIEALEGLPGGVPKIAQRAEDEEPWAITFPTRQPVSVAFEDGRFSVTVRGRRFARGDSEYPTAMNVTATYAIERRAGRYVAVRREDVDVLPPGFKPGKSRLSVRQQVLRDMVGGRFDKVFPEEIPVDDIVVPGEQLRGVGRLRLVHWQTHDGWMVLAWQRVGM